MVASREVLKRNTEEKRQLWSWSPKRATMIGRDRPKLECPLLIYYDSYKESVELSYGRERRGDRRQTDPRTIEDQNKKNRRRSRAKRLLLPMIVVILVIIIIFFFASSYLPNIFSTYC